MTYHETITTLGNDPEQLEQTYQAAVRAGRDDAFREAIDASRAAAPDNLLYAAWHYRLRQTAVRAAQSFTNWGWALPLGIITGLILWFLSDEIRFPVTIASIPHGQLASNYFPLVILLAAPIVATMVMVYLAVAGRRRWGMAVVISMALLAAGAYVYFLYPRLGTRPYQEQYLTLMAAHLPLLAWAGVGAYLLYDRRDPTSRFAFLIKSLELFVMGGLFAIAGGIFTGITVGLFDTLGVTLPEVVIRLFVAGGAGLLAVIAVAVLYNPNVPPAGQSFDEGLSKLVAMLARVLLPLTLLVLLVYLAFVPFNFFEPFENRDVLIIYNAMLFAVIALLVGVTPARLDQLSPRMGRWLRWGIIALAALAAVVSLYALAAIVYRTAIDRLTPNRLTFIGWNIINIGLLLLVLLYQARRKGDQWLGGLHRAFGAGMVAYAVWALVVILALPWLFGGNRERMAGLPVEVQSIIYMNPDPVLLKCAGSPHIYLIDGGQKRWIDTIDTFEARGYEWRDVRFVTCEDLRAVPDGQPIPADAGPPPEP